MVESEVGIVVLIGDFFDNRETLLASSSCMNGLDNLEIVYLSYSVRDNMQLLASNDFFRRTTTIKIAVFEIDGK